MTIRGALKPIGREPCPEQVLAQIVADQRIAWSYLMTHT